jgi:hypothetical protein
VTGSGEVAVTVGAIETKKRKVSYGTFWKIFSFLVCVCLCVCMRERERVRKREFSVLFSCLIFYFVVEGKMIAAEAAISLP